MASRIDKSDAALDKIGAIRYNFFYNKKETTSKRKFILIYISTNIHQFLLILEPVPATVNLCELMK